MIETASGLANVEEIAAVDGVSALYVGPSDLSIALGMPPASLDEPAFAETLERIRRAAADAGVIAGMHTGDGARASTYVEQGFGMISSGRGPAELAGRHCRAPGSSPQRSARRQIMTVTAEGQRPSPGRVRAAEDYTVLVGIGETMAVLTSPETGRLRDACSLGLTTAGAESNVAIGVRRLGYRTAWIGRLGPDELGEKILADLRREGVDVSAAVVDKGAATGLMFKERRLPRHRPGQLLP